jgi:hypothetical protein
MFVTEKDTLIVEVVNAQTSAKLRATVFIEDPSGSRGELSVDLPAAPAALGSSRLLETYRLKLSRGKLLSCIVYQLSGGSAAKFGSTYVMAYLQRSTMGNVGLCKGYLTWISPLFWLDGGGATVESNGGMGGRHLIKTVTTPAAGAVAYGEVPDGAIWRIRSMSFKLVTAVAVADRTVWVTVTDSGAKPLFYGASHPVQAASATVIYYAVNDYPLPVDAAVDAGMIRSFLPQLVLTRSSKINIAVNNIQGADQLSDIRLNVEEWLELE